MLQQTIEKLHTLRLAAMADGLRSQMTQPEIAAMPFDGYVHEFWPTCADQSWPTFR